MPLSMPLDDAARAEREEERGLIERCQRGDRDAFEPLVKRYMRRAAAFALGWTGSREDALDLSQDAFVRAYRAIARFDTARPFYPWFHRILKNLCINHLSRAGRGAEVPIEVTGPLASAADGPQRLAEREELRRTVWEAIRRLGEADREILVLREFQDLTYAEIASVLEIPKGTVMSRLHNARKRLREKLEPYWNAHHGGGNRPDGSHT